MNNQFHKNVKLIQVMLYLHKLIIIFVHIKELNKNVFIILLI